MRSVNVNPKEIVGKPDWCSYAIDHRIAMFMDAKKLKEYQAHPFWNIGDRGFSCGWMSACKRAWDFAYPYISSALSSAEGIQIRELQEKRKKVPERNKQAEIEKKPKQAMPEGLSPLRGKNDQYVSFYIPLEGFTALMKEDCNWHFEQNGFTKKIDPKLNDESDEQDESYISSYQYAFGMFQELHYRYLQMRQLHILYLPSAQIMSTDYRYNFDLKKFEKKT